MCCSWNRERPLVENWSFASEIWSFPMKSGVSLMATYEGWYIHTMATYYAEM